MSSVSSFTTSARAWLVILSTTTALLLLAPGALAAGTVTVAVTGQGSATGDGINCTQTGGPDCSESYADDTYQDCDPDRRPPCFTVSESPYREFTAGTGANGFVYDGWLGCDSVTGRVCGLTVETSTTITARFRDAQAPSVAAPAPSSGVQRGTISLAASATDNSGTVQRVDFRVRGVLVGSDSSAPFSVAFDTASVADGPATLRATAIDAAGNSNFSESGFTIDNTPPTLSVTSGPDGQTFAPGSTQTWTFSAGDATSGVAAVECSVVASGAPASFGACSGGTSSHAVTNRPDGSYTFTVRARDGSGLVTTAPVRTFAIDATPPETTITAGPAEGSSSTDTSATFDFTSSEAGTTFECRVYPAALTPPVFGSCSAPASHTASGFAPGTYAFEVRALDPTGNVDASPAKRTFVVIAPSTGPGTDNGPGTGTSTNPGPGTDRGPELPVARASFDPRVSHGADYRRARTTFKKLTISGLLKGSKVVASCRGKGCRFKKRAIASGGGKLNVLKKLKRVRLRAGAVLQLRITGPAGDLKVVTWKMRKGKSPAVSYRCAKPGAKLGRCA